jgi:hypothetical protein
MYDILFYPGLPADMLEKIRNEDTVEVWTQDGDTYSCTVKSKVWPEKRGVIWKLTYYNLLLFFIITMV